MIERNLEKIYAGFLGMNIGIRLGAPVEPTVWTYERIRHYYGDIAAYVKPFKNFAADDDANGPYYFLRALYDRVGPGKLTAQDVAEAWLNYAREGVGMFWWGGYGVSTEHTAYLNLKNGMKAPASGSAAVNGMTLAEQIGGQIFIDTWGLIFPGEPGKAAEYASAAASVSHDRNGVYGAAFIAGCIAAAFESGDPDEIVRIGLDQIPADSTYARIVRDVIDFHAANPDDWRACMKRLHENWGYDKYPGVCHIIPNAGVCVMALLYGRTFARTVEIATMAGWDTDCNAGNVGTIMGVAAGLAGIPARYREPINDMIVLSGISGYLNILDIPTYARELYRLSERLREEEETPVPVDPKREGTIRFDFELPGATHNFRVSDANLFRLRQSAQTAHSGNGSLEILVDRLQRGQKGKVFYKPFYRREDFNDTRYMPVFSPKAYPGQTVSFWVCSEKIGGEDILISPYVRNTFTKSEIFLGALSLEEPGWKKVEFTIPDLDGAMVDEIGFWIESNSSIKNRDFRSIFLDDFSVAGPASYRIDFAKSAKEFDSVIPFAHDHGAWEIVGGRLEAMRLNGCEALTGNYFTRDVRLESSVVPFTGTSHCLALRVQGAQRGYYAGLKSGGAAIYRKSGGVWQELADIAYDWKAGEEIAIAFEAAGPELTLSLGGRRVLSVADETLKYGMVGFASKSEGRSSFGALIVKETEEA